ncbi:MAG: hypothetical protein ACLFNT_00125 [Spirochaetales bacterium]
MRRISATCALLLAVAISLSAANVSIPNYQLLTRGTLDSGSFTLRTQANVDVLIGGGYKFGGQLGLGVDTDNVEQPADPEATYSEQTLEAALGRTLTLNTAQVIVRDLFSSGIDLHYFVGEYDRLLTGDLFPDRFGTGIIATDLRGLVYFPDGVVYNGVHLIDGTGLAVSASSIAPWLYLDGAIYQDSILGPGFYSADVRAGFNLQNFKAETFLGASVPQASFGVYRGGLLLYYSTGEGAAVMTQIGIPRWAPGSDGSITIDDFYFLFEPRVYVGIISIVLTLFRHPEYYLQAPTNEQGATDIIARFIAGNVEENALSGGLEGGVRLRPEGADNTLEVSASPFLTINASGVVWDIKTKFNVLPWEPSSMFEAYIGVRTQF